MCWSNWVGNPRTTGGTQSLKRPPVHRLVLWAKTPKPITDFVKKKPLFKVFCGEFCHPCFPLNILSNIVSVKLFSSRKVHNRVWRYHQPMKYKSFSRIDDFVISCGSTLAIKSTWVSVLNNPRYVMLYNRQLNIKNMKCQLLDARPHLYIVVIVVTDHHVQHGSAVDIELFKLNKLKWDFSKV